MMNKKAIAMFIEIIGGTVAAIGIIVVLIVIITSGSSSMVDGANKQALESLVSGAGKTINTQISGGESTINIWNLNSYSSYVYSLVFIPFGTANKIYDEFNAQNRVSFVEKLDFASIDEIKKCGADSKEACMCLFKIEYKDDCAPDNNIITLNMTELPSFGAASYKSESKYGYELYKADEWAQSNFVDGIKWTDVSSAKVITCTQLVNSGCMHIDAEGNTGPCILHYKNAPVVWLSSEKGNPLSFENIMIDLKSYSSVPPDNVDYFGSFPDIDFTLLKSSEFRDGDLQVHTEKVFTTLNPAVEAVPSRC